MLQAGDVLGRYVLLDRLASGGMGDVYLASKAGPLGLGPLVALKLLRSEVQADPKFIEMLADEAKISMFLNHQNIVSVLDFSEARGAHFLVMEYVQGTTAQALVDAAYAGDVRIGVPVATFIAAQVARALRYAHDRKDDEGRALNIVHRDVTPANVLLSCQGEVKLTDFGIARARNRIHQTQAGVVKGKFGYLPPEAVRTQHMDRRADIFCAGVSLYLLVTGRHPAADKTAFQAVEMYERREVVPPSRLAPEVPPSLDEAIMRAIDPDPGRRWPDAASWERALHDALLSQPDTRRQGSASNLEGIIEQLVPSAAERPISDAEMKAAWERAKTHLDPAYAEGTQATFAASRLDPLKGSDDLVLEPEEFPPAVMDRPTDASAHHRPALTSLDHEPFLPDEDEEQPVLDDRTLADGLPLDDDKTWLGSLPSESEPEVEPDLEDRTFAGLRMPEDRDTQPSDAGIPVPPPAESAPEAARSAPTLEPSTPLPGSFAAPRAPAPYFDDEPASRPEPSSRPRTASRIPPRPARERSRARPHSGPRPVSTAGPEPLPSVPPLGGHQPKTSGRGLSTLARWLIVAAGFVLLLGAGLAVGLSSSVFWPRIELISRPPGAVVVVNGRPSGRTPTTVQVAPGPGPRVEFRLTDHRSEARALVGTVRRGRTYRMSVELRPLPVLHVQPEATVWLGGQIIGKGTRVQLEPLPEGPFEVRVEAPGFVPYQRRFASEADLPSTWDVTLSKQ